MTDMDENSILNKVRVMMTSMTMQDTDDEKWTAIFKCGVLTLEDEGRYTVAWDEKQVCRVLSSPSLYHRLICILAYLRVVERWNCQIYVGIMVHCTHLMTELV